MRRSHIKSIYLIALTSFMLLACGGEVSVNEEPGTANVDQQVEAFLEKHDANLTPAEIRNIQQVARIAEKQGLDFSKMDSTFLKYTDDWINLDMEEATKRMKFIKTMQQYSDTVTALTNKWRPRLEAADSKEEADSLLQRYNREKQIARDSIFNGVDTFGFN